MLYTFTLCDAVLTDLRSQSKKFTVQYLVTRPWRARLPSTDTGTVGGTSILDGELDGGSSRGE